MCKFNNKQGNSVISLFFYAVKLYLDNNKQEKIEENNQQYI